MNQTKKRILYIVGCVSILLAGLLLGFFVSNTYVLKNKAGFCAPATTAPISDQQATEATALTPGKTLFGRVTKKEGDRFSMTTQLSAIPNAVGETTGDTTVIKDVAVTIPVGPQDMIVRMRRNAAGEAIIENASFADMTMGSYVTVKVLDAKKIIYLPTL